MGGEDPGEVAELLRDAGACVTVHQSAGEPITAEHEELPVSVVIVTGKRGRRLVEAVAGLCGGSDRAVVVVCDRAGAGDVRSLLRAGARGVVLREEAATTLVPTLEAVASGQVCVPFRHKGDVEPAVLSIRERQVVRMAAMGLTNTEIADRLFLAESTVKSHLSASFAKLGVSSRHEAVDLIVNSARSMSLGIPTPGAEPLEATSSEDRRR